MSEAEQGQLGAPAGGRCWRVGSSEATGVGDRQCGQGSAPAPEDLLRQHSRGG